MSKFVVSFSEAVGSLATSHLVFSGFGICSAALAQPPPPPAIDVEPSGNIENRHQEANILRIVSKVYRGGGLDANACTDDVSFTDPAAHCSGKKEVVEAFRALRACNPQHISLPVVVGPGVSDDFTEVYLHQRYFAGKWWPRGLEVRSTLIVRVADSGCIRSLEERWNGAALLQWSPFRWVRRANGLLSSTLTPLLL